MTLPLRCLASVAAACLLAPTAWAQQTPTSEEQVLREARAVAKQSTQDAFDVLEDYGRGVNTPPPSPEALRDRALERLADPEREPVPAPTRPAFDPANDVSSLRSARHLIRQRLHDLDPERFPLRRPKPRPAPEPLELKIVDVQDLVFVPEDHYAPPVGLGLAFRPNGGVGGVLRFDEESEYTQGVGISPDKLFELVEAELGEESAGSVEYARGRLILRKTATEIAKISALLERLAERRGGLVDLEVRLYRMPPNLFAGLRESASALTVKGEEALAAAVSDGRATLLSTHRVVAHDGQQVHVRRGGSRSFVSDIDVNQTGVIPVRSPRVNVLNEGLVVELRPLVDRERRVVLVDAALSLSGLHDPIESRMLEGIELELPSMAIARTGSSTCVPLGRGALLGGVFRIDGDDGKPQTCVVYVRPNLVQGK